MCCLCCSFLPSVGIAVFTVLATGVTAIAAAFIEEDVLVCEALLFCCKLLCKCFMTAVLKVSLAICVVRVTAYRPNIFAFSLRSNSRREVGTSMESDRTESDVAKLE